MSYSDSIGGRPTPNHFYGEVKPRQYRREAKSAEEKEWIVGRRGNYFSVLRIRLLEPTAEYPDVAVAISLGNGASSAFAQIRPQEFRSLLEAIQAEWNIMLGLLPNLEQKSAIYNAEKAKRDGELALLAQVMGTGDTEGMDPQKVMQMIAAFQQKQQPPEVKPQ